jgi:uncharacterized protein
MGFHPHYLIDVIFAALTTFALAILAWRAACLKPHLRRAVRAAMCFVFAFAWFTAALATVKVSRYFAGPVIVWIRCIGLFIEVGTIYGTLLLSAVWSTRSFSSGRRRAVKAAATVAAVVPAGVAAFGIARRDDLRFREIDIRVPNLPADLNGLRIAQVTDIHLSSFVPEWLLERAVGMANDARPDIAFVTGDLISTRGDPLDKCLQLLRGLRADAGVFGCCGNHEIYAGAESYVTRQAPRHGMRFLRNESTPLYFGRAVLNLAGVDYQRRGRPYLVDSEELLLPGAFNLLLSHNPDVFPVAASKGFDLTVAGHTHGGQIQFEIIHPSLNIVRFATPYVYGVYEQDDKRMYVSRGVGTIGVPARVGAPPEVVCLRLCAI